MPPESASLDRITTIADIVTEHSKAAVAGISGARDFAVFLRELGFARTAAKKLAPAFKSLAPNGEDDEVSRTERLLSELKALHDTVRQRGL